MIILYKWSGCVGRFLGRNNKKGAYFLIVLFGNDWQQSCFFLISERQELTNIVSTISVGWWNQILPYSKQCFYNRSSHFIWSRKKCKTWSWPDLERFQDYGTDREKKLLIRIYWKMALLFSLILARPRDPLWLPWPLGCPYGMPLWAATLLIPKQDQLMV